MEANLEFWKVFQGTNKSVFEAKLLSLHTWDQPRCPTTNEYVKKMWYRYTIEFYSAKKKNEILSFV
jgi:hypothetical protein